MKALTADRIVKLSRVLMADDPDYDEATFTDSVGDRMSDSDMLKAVNYACREYCKFMLATSSSDTITVDETTGLSRLPNDNLLVQRIFVERA